MHVNELLRKCALINFTPEISIMDKIKKIRPNFRNKLLKYELWVTDQELIEWFSQYQQGWQLQNIDLFNELYKTLDKINVGHSNAVATYRMECCRPRGWGICVYWRTHFSVTPPTPWANLDGSSETLLVISPKLPGSSERGKGIKGLVWKTHTGKHLCDIYVYTISKLQF